MKKKGLESSLTRDVIAKKRVERQGKGRKLGGDMHTFVVYGVGWQARAKPEKKQQEERTMSVEKVQNLAKKESRKSLERDLQRGSGR